MSSLAAIFQIGSLGDSIVSVPVVRSLRELLPDCSEYLLVSRFDTQINVMPSHIFEMAWGPKHRVDYLGTGSKLQKAASIASVIARLRYYRPRYCVYLMPVDRTAHQVRRDRLFFRAAGVQELIGFRPLLDSELSPSSGMTVQGTEAYLRFLRVWDDRAEEKFATYGTSPVLKPSDAAKQHVKNWLNVQQSESGNRKLVAVCPYSNFDSKSWSHNTAVDLVKRLEQQAGVKTVLLGGGKDKEAADEVIRSAGTGVNACGVFSPAQSAALLQDCSLVICADSGPMHLAGALGIPTVTTFSRISESLHRWFPLGRDHTILYREVPCAGCRQTSCPVQGHPCMQKISVDDLLSAAISKLQGLPGVSGTRSNGTQFLDWRVPQN